MLCIPVTTGKLEAIKVGPREKIFNGRNMSTAVGLFDDFGWNYESIEDWIYIYVEREREYKRGLWAREGGGGRG